MRLSPGPIFRFSLFGGADLSATCATSHAMDAYCEAIPAAGAPVHCPSSLTIPTPLQLLACGAAELPVTVAYNTCELDVINNLRYNTQVVFSRGMVVTSYRKRHPWYPACFATPTLELRTFPLHGVDFGVFTCYDILFSDPKDLLVAQGVRYGT